MTSQLKLQRRAMRAPAEAVQTTARYLVGTTVASQPVVESALTPAEAGSPFRTGADSSFWSIRFHRTSIAIISSIAANDFATASRPRRVT